MSITSKILIFLFILNLMSQNTTIFNFSKDTNKNSWMVVNDDVMGGISSSAIIINTNGNGVFSGSVSLENNGGFASVRHVVKGANLNAHSKFIIKVKGDGKKYQFRCKSRSNERHSYVFDFKTNGDWQEIEIPFSEMYPRFRGNNLNMSNYAGDMLAEIAFLIGNNKPENFKLEIDYINVQ